MSEQILDIPAGEPAAEPAAPEVPAAPAGTLLENQPEPSQLDLFPEAFRVLKGEELDVTASAKALAEAYQARAAYGDIPANDAEYNPVDLGEGTKWEEVKELPAVKSFAEEAKKVGMTHEQFAFALKTVAAAELDGRTYAMQHNKEESEKQLREEWKDPNSYDLNIKAAGAALRTFIPAEEQKAFSERYGNDAGIIRLLAKIGSEISEDQPLGMATPTPSAEDVKSLMASEAYMDSKHPEHAATMEKVQRFYLKHYGTQETL